MDASILFALLAWLTAGIVALLAHASLHEAAKAMRRGELYFYLSPKEAEVAADAIEAVDYAVHILCYTIAGLIIAWAIWIIIW